MYNFPLHTSMNSKTCTMCGCALPKDGPLAWQELVDKVGRRSAAVYHLDGHCALVFLGRSHLYLGVTALLSCGPAYSRVRLRACRPTCSGAWGGVGSGGGCCRGRPDSDLGLTHGAWHLHTRTPMCPLPAPASRGAFYCPGNNFCLITVTAGVTLPGWGVGA